MTDRIWRVLQAASRHAALISAVGVLFLVVVISADVFRRNTTGRAVPGVVEIAAVVMVFVVFLGLGYAEQSKAHVRLTFFVNLLPERAARVIRSAGLLLAVAFLGLAVVVTARQAWTSYVSGEFRFGLLRVPVWPARVAVFLGFALVLPETVLTLIRAWRGESTDKDFTEGGL